MKSAREFGLRTRESGGLRGPKGPTGTKPANTRGSVDSREGGNKGSIVLTRPLITIYALTDPRTHQTRYVGQTVDLETRTQQHFGGRRSQRNPRLRGWLRELRRAELEPGVRTLEVCRTPEDADTQERYWIRRFIAQGVDLLNVCDGGARAISPALHTGRDQWFQIATRLRIVRGDLLELRELIAESGGSAKPPVKSLDRSLTTLDQSREHLLAMLQALFPEWGDDLTATLYE